MDHILNTSKRNPLNSNHPLPILMDLPADWGRTTVNHRQRTTQKTQYYLVPSHIPFPESVKNIVPTYVSRMRARCWRHVNAFLCYPHPSLLKPPFSPHLGCTTSCTSAFPSRGCCNRIPTFPRLLSLPHFLQSLFLQHQFQESLEHYTSLSWTKAQNDFTSRRPWFTKMDSPFQVLHVTNTQLFKQSKVWLKWEKFSWACLRYSSWFLLCLS